MISLGPSGEVTKELFQQLLQEMNKAQPHNFSYGLAASWPLIEHMVQTVGMQMGMKRPEVGLQTSD